MVRRYIRPPHLQPSRRGRTPPHPTGHPRQHRPHALQPERLPAQTSKISPTQGQVFSFVVPTEHCDPASDPRIAAQQRYGLMALLRPKRPVRPGMREILLLCSANPAECRMIRSRRPAMTSMLYHQGNRAFQDEFGSRRLADRLEQKLSRTAFSDDDKTFIESCIYFFMATADTSGHPDCSFKGGAPGFVRVTGPSELAFPDYDGNGMFKSLGNIAVNPHVGLLFIAMHGKPQRLRVNGSARVLRDDPLMHEIAGAQLIIRVATHAVFPNCPRNIPELKLEKPSKYVPVLGEPRVEPGWKNFDAFKDVVP